VNLGKHDVILGKHWLAKHNGLPDCRRNIKHRREEDFGGGDYVMVTTKSWNLRRPTRKLAEQSVGPFRITERVGNAYRVDLPAGIKVHPIFASEKLRRASRTEPLNGQIADPPP